MLASIWSFFGWKKEKTNRELTPPPVTITGIRIPADGTPAHLLSLTTISVSKNVDSFLFHFPDLRQFWKTERAWRYRNVQRFEFEQQCNGIYYAFSSFDMDDLPENLSLPTWISSRRRTVYCGDVFWVKMAPHEWG